MFKGKKQTIDPNTTDTLIGEGSVFEGNIKSEATIRVEGQITGDITCSGDVIISEKGVVRSDIIARNVVIAGKVYGDITAKEKISIVASGQLYGNLHTQSFTIEEGGVFEGTSKMNSTPDSTQSADPSPDKLLQEAT